MPPLADTLCKNTLLDNTGYVTEACTWDHIFRNFTTTLDPFASQVVPSSWHRLRRNYELGRFHICAAPCRASRIVERQWVSFNNAALTFPTFHNSLVLQENHAIFGNPKLSSISSYKLNHPLCKFLHSVFQPSCSSNLDLPKPRTQVYIPLLCTRALLVEVLKCLTLDFFTQRFSCLSRWACSSTRFQFPLRTMRHLPKSYGLF